MLLSVTIITKNCAHTLEACLTSVQALADEIIILDSNSTDNTIAIAKRFTDKITITQEWIGFGPQKQLALIKAQGTWVLSIDADEVLTQECQNEIRAAIQQNTFDGYEIKRQMVFAGKALQRGDCIDYYLRLFKRTQGKFSSDLVHETILLNGKIGRINSPMLHYSYSSIGEWIEKMNRYSELGANKKSSLKKYSLRYAILSALFSFSKMYFLKRGILDGRLGFVASINTGIASYYKYLKLAFDKDFTLPRV